MSCPSEARLAAAVAGEDLTAAAHADGCARCAAIVADGRAIRAALASLPAPSPRRRAEVLAEVLAEAERDTAASRRASPRGRWRVAAAAIVVAAMVTGAAAGVGAVRQRVTARRSMAVEVLRPATTARPAPRVGVAPRATAIAAAPPPVIAPPAMEAAPIAPPPSVAPPPVAPPSVAPPSVAPPSVAPRGGAPSGGAAIDGRRRSASSTARPPRETPAPRAVEAGGEPVAPPAPPPIGVAAFRAGWEALRAGQPLVARAHFDRAGDPAVAEDAAYWAAVASERAGDRLEAARRHRRFAQAFPASPRAADARAAAARLYDQ
ncbi:MAG: hypothetical protein IPH80_25650 [Myxococcales bacterium]|nr:hypothetical protein [Myxococcales bacterium]